MKWYRGALVTESHIYHGNFIISPTSARKWDILLCTERILCKHEVVFECLLFLQVALDGDINQTCHTWVMFCHSF